MFIDKPKIDYIETTSGVLTLSGQLRSLITTGTAPLSIISTTSVSNLNADMLDGKHASDLQTTINSGNLSATSPIQQTGGTGAVIGSGVTISILDSSVSQKGSVQLSNSYSGTSQTLATTEKALSDGLATKQNTTANIITGSGTSGQLAQFNGINNIVGGGTLTAASVSVSTVAFNKNLTTADDTVQKALNTLDDLTTSGAGSDTTAIHNNISGELTAISAKATPVDADHLLIEDSADTNKKKSITRAGLFASPITSGITITGDFYSPSITAHNYIINGDMAIAQRGTSFAGAASGTFTVDRFSYYQSGDMVHTLSQDTDVPANSIFKYSYKADVTTADSSIAVDDYCFIMYKVEGYDFSKLVGKTATLGFWVKGAKTGVHCVAFRNSASDRSYVAEYTINTANTWEFKTITITFNYSGGTWNYINGIGIAITFAMACGSTYQTTKDSWQTGNYLATSDQVNETDSTDNNFYITGIMLNEGSVAMPFRLCGGSFGNEVELCERYYQKSYPLTIAPGTAATYVGAVFRTLDATCSYGGLICTFRTRMRTTPGVITIYSPYSGTSGKIYCEGTTDNNGTAVQGGETGFGCYISGISTGQHIGIQLHWIADSEL